MNNYRFGAYEPTEATVKDKLNMNRSYDLGMNTFTSGFSGACKYISIYICLN